MKNEFEYMVDRLTHDSDMRTIEWFIEKYDLAVKSRKRDLVVKRAILMHEIRKRTLLTVEKIGLYFGKNHSSVTHNVSNVFVWKRIKDEIYLRNLKEVEQDLKSINFNK